MGVDSTLPEASALMKSSVRRDTGEHPVAYVCGLAKAEGVEQRADSDAQVTETVAEHS